jgi:hypothetical protein
MTENRQHPRYAIELDASIETDQGTVLGRTRDLSKGGFCILAPEPLTIGSRCRVRLALVFSENQFSEQLELEATVMWCTPIQGQHQIGVKLAPLDAQSRGYLDLFVKFLEGGDEEDEGEEEAHDGEDSEV